MKSIQLEIDDVDFAKLKSYSNTRNLSVEETAGDLVARSLNEIAQEAVEDDAIFKH